MSESQQSLCDNIENAMMLLGGTLGAPKGGGEGFLLALPTGEVAGVVTIPAGAILEGAAGAAAGKLWGKALTNVLFSKRGDSGEASGGEEEQYKKLSRGDIELLKKNDLHPHEIKSEPASRFDLFKDRAGNVYEMLKGGKGEPNALGINLNDLKR